MKQIEKDIPVILNLINTAKFDLAISKLKRLIRDYPEYIILYNLLGSAYQNTGNYNLAKNIFTKGNKMEPNNIAIMNYLRKLYKKNLIILMRM